LQIGELVDAAQSGAPSNLAARRAERCMVTESGHSQQGMAMSSFDLEGLKAAAVAVVGDLVCSDQCTA
jgi:hypothetical protein